ncbi:MAG: hypothetical protein AAF959_07450 [Cyanobacteria bacterium P01_D01_bin.56]
MKKQFDFVDFAPKTPNSGGFESSLPQNWGNPDFPHLEDLFISIGGGLDI